ncbi:hypothetical protein EDC01DRAFT_310745 [Geopyxis carbonaria]|nr:hypothetical protein EDC01DRAFT_310745 [Geopyxis carbonaria]
MPQPVLFCSSFLHIAYFFCLFFLRLLIWIYFNNPFVFLVRDLPKYHKPSAHYSLSMKRIFISTFSPISLSFPISISSVISIARSLWMSV